MKTRCTKSEKEKRVLQVQDWIIEGSQDNVILRRIKTEWGISLRQSRKYLKDAYNNWLPDEIINIENRSAAKIAELKQDKQSLKEKYKGTPQGMRAKLAIDREINKLENLYPARKIDITTKGESLQYQPIWGRIDPMLDDRD